MTTVVIYRNLDLDFSRYRKWDRKWEWNWNFNVTKFTMFLFPFFSVLLRVLRDSRARSLTPKTYLSELQKE